MSHQAVVRARDQAYRDYVNPQWARLLEIMRMDVSYSRCSGVELFAEGRGRVLDFLSGYCVHNTGHNHPAIVEALREELARSGPAMLQSHVPELAGELARRLVERAGGRLAKAFFCSSGSEGVEAAIKFARAHTRRSDLLSCRGAFHGLTCGALSLMDSEFWTSGFGPMLPGVEQVPFGNLEALERALGTRRFAAFIVEPIQGEAGIRLPPPEYLSEAAALARRYGTLLVLDEVQTGFYRTGKFLAAHHWDVEPDMVVLAKALSGGLVPSGAVLMSESICRSVYGSLKRAIVHTSTFGENGLAMRAGIATLDVLEGERLGERAAAMGLELTARLREALAPFEMVKEVRGLGLFCGIEFAAPRQLRLRIPFRACERIHPALFGQMLVMRLFNDHRLLTQMCGNSMMVLKATPPLVVTLEQIREFVDGVAAVAGTIHSSREVWLSALDIGRRALGASPAN